MTFRMVDLQHVLRELPSSPVPASCCTALLEAYSKFSIYAFKNKLYMLVLRSSADCYVSIGFCSFLGFVSYCLEVPHSM